MEPDRRLPRVNGVGGEETDAVEALYVAACPRLVSLLTTIGGNRADAEEVAQEAFVTLLERWPVVRGYEDPEGWVRLVAVRRLVSRQRRRAVATLGLRRLAGRAERAGPVPGEDRVDVERALAVLPVAQRAVVVLHHGLDLPLAEVAATLGIPVGTVKSRLARARTALGPLLTADDTTRSAP